MPRSLSWGSGCCYITGVITELHAKASSVARVTKAWYVACKSSELGASPIARRIFDTPIVLFRGTNGVAGVLVDRCPHRNVPLSLGRVNKDGQLECGYHGWCFDQAGACKKVPALRGRAESDGRAAPAFVCREQDGLIWVWCDRTSAPDVDPFRFELAGAPGYTTVIDRVVANSTVHAAAENALDVPHTAFLHSGLFRSDDRPRNKIEVVVRRASDRVEAEYIGEPRPGGLVGRILSPQGGVVTHFDRFILPSIVQVEYKLGASHLLVSAALTPVEDYVTHLYSVISFKLPLPGFMVTPFLRPIAMGIFKQDARILAAQTENIRRFGGEQYVSTEVDVLGPHILRLLRQAERGVVAGAKAPEVSASEKRFEMDV
jgi:phenylpropionate dioxygenase-like ring-hydroxylating dioxygenase large terminal subunit